MKQASFLVPALLKFPGSSARLDSWGRLLKITAGGAELSTASPLAIKESVLVQFELGGERLCIRASVHHASDDQDGGHVIALRWDDLVERRRLARVLLNVLAQS